MLFEVAAATAASAAAIKRKANGRRRKDEKKFECYLKLALSFIIIQFNFDLLGYKDIGEFPKSRLSLQTPVTRDFYLLDTLKCFCCPASWYYESLLKKGSFSNLAQDVVQSTPRIWRFKKTVKVFPGCRNFRNIFHLYTSNALEKEKRELGVGDRSTGLLDKPRKAWMAWLPVLVVKLIKLRELTLETERLRADVRVKRETETTLTSRVTLSPSENRKHFLAFERTGYPRTSRITIEKDRNPGTSARENDTKSKCWRMGRRVTTKETADVLPLWKARDQNDRTEQRSKKVWTIFPDRIIPMDCHFQ
ncbi:hypothetical protein V1477_014830 [Vespula maculifrons]|uniref:Uncharacterized protein n=1 Tax=Vespula maculifrons TaxID=7453 RepID=A0ABD2BIK9_VESMC